MHLITEHRLLLGVCARCGIYPLVYAGQASPLLPERLPSLQSPSSPLQASASALMSRDDNKSWKVRLTGKHLVHCTASSRARLERRRV